MAKGALDEVVRWLDRAAVNALYKGRARAAEQVVAELQELGPRWSGKFSNSWRISTPTGTTAGGTGQEGNPVPVKAPELSGADVKNKLLGSPFKIDNTAFYADVATDLATGDFENPGKPALKPVSRGNRTKGIRGEPWPVPGTRGTEGPNRATAPLDWFTTYLNGGSLDKAVKRAMRQTEKGFK
jgi:hypothetical protein